MKKSFAFAGMFALLSAPALAQRGAGGGAVAAGGIALTDYVIEIVGTIAALIIIFFAVTAMRGVQALGGVVIGLLCLMVALNPYDIVSLIPGGGLR